MDDCQYRDGAPAGGWIRRPSQRRDAAALHRRQAARGFSLLEVLITMLILAVGLIGSVGLQLSGLAYTQAAYQRSHATTVMSDLVERMRANPGAVANGAYEGSFSVARREELVTPDCASKDDEPCAPGDAAAADLATWVDQRLSALGAAASARVAAATTSPGLFTITVRWTEAGVDDGSGNAPARAVTLEVRL